MSDGVSVVLFCLSQSATWLLNRIWQVCSWGRLAAASGWAVFGGYIPTFAGQALSCYCWNELYGYCIRRVPLVQYS